MWSHHSVAKSQTDHPRPLSASQFVTWSPHPGCKITNWPSHGLCRFSVCTWSPHSGWQKSQTDHPTAFVASQQVPDLLTAVKNHKLIISRPLFASQAVCGLLSGVQNYKLTIAAFVFLSDSMWSPQWGSKLQADHPVTFVASQRVRDLLTTAQNHKLTILWPLLPLRLYVVFSLGCARSQTDHPAAFVIFQVVCDLLTGVQNHNWPSPGLCHLSVLYVNLLMGCKITNWLSCGLCHLSASMWYHLFGAKSWTDHPTPLSPQDVCDLFTWDAKSYTDYPVGFVPFSWSMWFFMWIHKHELTISWGCGLLGCMLTFSIVCAATCLLHYGSLMSCRLCIVCPLSCETYC